MVSPPRNRVYSWIKTGRNEVCGVGETRLVSITFFHDLILCSAVLKSRRAGVPLPCIRPPLSRSPPLRKPPLSRRLKQAAAAALAAAKDAQASSKLPLPHGC